VARLLADENFPLSVVEALRRLGHDILTIAEAGKAGRSLTDEAVLSLAAADDRAVVTLNRRHFVRLHAAGRAHAGIIVCTLDLDFEEQAERIQTAIIEHAPVAGHLIRVNRPAVP
jgi:predicted nuclease of predicted toxin-antitoxin system